MLQYIYIYHVNIPPNKELGEKVRSREEPKNRIFHGIYFSVK